MNAEIVKSLNEIISESGGGTANLTPNDLVALNVMVDAGYSTDELYELAKSSAVKARVFSEKISEFPISALSTQMIELALANSLVDRAAVKSVETKAANAKVTKVCFKPDKLDGAVLMQNGSIAVFRTGLQLPSIISLVTTGEAEMVYASIVKDLI